MKKRFLLTLLTVISCLFAITVSTTSPSIFLSPKPLMAQEVVQRSEGTYRKLPNQANQDDSWTCGANSASRVLKYYGHDVSYPQVRGVAQKDHGIIPTKVCVGGEKCAFGVCVPLPQKCLDTSQFKTGLEADEVRAILARWEGGNAKLSTRTSFEELKARVREGKPVIALKRVGSFKPKPRIFGTWPKMHWVTVHGLSESAQKVYYTDTDDNSVVREQPYSEFLSEWDWSIGAGLANETIWGKGVRPKTMVWVDRSPPSTTPIASSPIASNYESFRLQTATALEPTGDNWDFDVLPNGDLVGINKSGTGSGKTEVHILAAQ
jgi:Peptidase_C39 like family